MTDRQITVLIADDEKDIRDILTLLLHGEGYLVLAAEDGQEVLDMASDCIDLYILDINMPCLSGLMTAAELRKKYDTPIIFLTAYSTESDKVMGFSAGADDYIVKPFSGVELLMRVRAILRRSGKTVGAEDNKAEKNRIQIGDAILDLDTQTIQTGNDTITLTFTEFKILELLATHRKKIYSVDNIYESIWNENAVGNEAIIVHIKNIRKKLGDNSRTPTYIKTAWGRGYYID